MKLQLIIVPLLIGIINTQGQPPPSSPITRLTSADQNLNILALPVGQGDATIIQCPTQYEGKLTVIDMGSSKHKGFMSKQDITKYLKGFIIEKVFLSHPDKDHINFLMLPYIICILRIILSSIILVIGQNIKNM